MIPQSPLAANMESSLESRDGTELLAEGKRIVSETAASGLQLRLLGGVAIALHCPESLGGKPHRSFADLDAVTSPRAGRRLSAALAELGYAPNSRFNASHGDRRLMFAGPTARLDVFVGRFQMCHTLDLADRLTLDEPTLTATDLLITKLQIVELNEKDASDAMLLLLEHELGSGPGDHIDVDTLSDVVRGDWGLWRTMTGTLNSLTQLDGVASERAAALIEVLDRAPKNRAFKLRARVGERVRWYELPEEVG
jgi:hypothetical protein